MSEPVSASSSLPGPVSPQTPRPHWGNRLAIGGILAMVLVPFSFGIFPREVARWYSAAATTAEWDDNYELAQERLAQAIAWDSGNPEWYLKRAKLHTDHQQYEAALADYETLLERDPENTTVLEHHSSACIHLKKYDAALEDWQKIRVIAERDGTYHPLQLNNGLAYYQALADRDLENALLLVNQAIAKDPNNPSIIDTRGYIYYRLGRYDEARQDLDRAIAQASGALLKAEKEGRKDYADQKLYDQEVIPIRQVVAVMAYHRALVLEKLGLEAEAAIDRARVRDLGFTPDEHLF